MTVQYDRLCNRDAHILELYTLRVCLYTVYNLVREKNAGFHCSRTGLQILFWGDEIVSDENIYSYIFIYAGELL